MLFRHKTRCSFKTFQVKLCQIIKTGKLGLEVGRIRDITTGLDGAIYFVTSNRDGRESARSGDDTLYRLSR
jgi:glucose/arabinose dehydrogenase